MGSAFKDKAGNNKDHTTSTQQQQTILIPYDNQHARKHNQRITEEETKLTNFGGYQQNFGKVTKKEIPLQQSKATDLQGDIKQNKRQWGI